MENNREIAQFVSFDLRGQAYKASNNHRTERLKPVYVYMILNVFFILLMVVLQVTRVGLSFGEKGGTISFATLAASFLMYCVYIYTSETTIYKTSYCFYNNTAIYVCVVGMIMLSAFFIFFIKIFGGSIRISYLIISAIVSFTANVIIIKERIKRGYYEKSHKQLMKERLFPIIVAIMFILRVLGTINMMYIIYYGTILIVIGFSGSISFYILQIVYAKKYGMENLLPQVRYMNINK